LISDTFIEHTLPLFDKETAFVLTNIAIFESNIDNVIFTCFSNNIKTAFTQKDYLYNCLISNEQSFPVSPGCALFRTADLKNALIVDIPNDYNWDFKKYGAGNDLLIFLMIARQYQTIRIVPCVESFFRGHDGSITASNKDTLAVYYEWSKYYFIENYYPVLLREYKSKFFIKIKILRSKIYTDIYKQIKAPLNILSIVKLVFKKSLSKRYFQK
jgi:hypothetical protein